MIVQTTQLQCYISFLLSVRTGSTRYHNTLSNIIGSDRAFQYSHGLMHSVSAESLTLSQVNDSGAQIHTIRFYIAEVYSTSLHCCAIPNPNTLMIYTLLYHVDEHLPFLLLCRAIPSPDT